MTRSAPFFSRFSHRTLEFASDLFRYWSLLSALPAGSMADVVGRPANQPLLIIRQVLAEYGRYRPANGEIDTELVVDAERDHFELLHVGWDGVQRVHGPVIHIDIIGDKVWIQYDGTNRPVADELMAAGIMGFEHFQVVLRGGRSRYGEADEAVRKLPHLEPDQDSVPMKGSTFYVMDDGQHAIELELMDAPVRLSCRFTLCHPPSVDLAFLGLLRELMVRLGMEAKICDDVQPAHSRSFSQAEFPDFLAITRHYIAARRAE